MNGRRNDIPEMPRRITKAHAAAPKPPKFLVGADGQIVTGDPPKGRPSNAPKVPSESKWGSGAPAKTWDSPPHRFKPRGPGRSSLTDSKAEPNDPGEVRIEPGRHIGSSFLHLPNAVHPPVAPPTNARIPRPYVPPSRSDMVNQHLMHNRTSESQYFKTLFGLLCLCV